MRNADNPRRRILKNFEDSLRQGATGIILHIEQDINKDDLADMLREAALRRPKIKQLILIFKNEIHILERPDILNLDF